MIATPLVVYGRNGPVTGVMGRKPVHLQSNKELTEIPPLSRMWLDIGAKDKDQALEHVALGDYVTVSLGTRQLLNGRLAAPGLDNKCASRRCAAVRGRTWAWRCTRPARCRRRSAPAARKPRRSRSTRRWASPWTC